MAGAAGGMRVPGGLAMFHSLHEFWRRHICDDVPIKMDLCLDCGEVNCLADQWNECAPRKARAAALAAPMTETSKSRISAAALSIGLPLAID